MAPERGRLADLAEVFAGDLSALKRLNARLDDWLPEGASVTPESSLVYASATVLHHIYNAIENLFRQTRKVFREELLESDQWHRALLAQMLAPTAERPAIFSPPFQPLLEELLRFRHRVRHSYDYQLDAEKLNALIALWRAGSAGLMREAEQFRAGIVAQVESSAS